MKAPLLALVLAAFLGLPARAADEPRQLWLYYPTNLLVDANIDKLQQIWERAAKAGYTHVLISDSKFNRFGEMPQKYFKNIERTKKIAADLKLTLVPAAFQVGYSNDMLSGDPNLAEGLPVKDAPFVVKGGEARAATDPVPSLAKIGFKDDPVTIADGVATFGPGGRVTRLSYKLKLPQHRYYHVSVKIKTQDYTGTPEIKALGGGRSLQHHDLGVKKTQDWTEHHVVFNSLDNTDVNLYFGVWTEKPAGLLQWKDWKIEEAGLVNLLRRPGTPLVVKREDGTVLEEGKDYETVKNPLTGTKPYAGQYEVWHAPVTIRVTNPSIGEGAKLLVSFYHTAQIHSGQACACIAEPKTMQLMTASAKRLMELFASPGYMMSHDEVRVMGWDEACKAAGKTPGQMLADNVRACRAALKPAGAYVWSDMFDPHHNAVPGPYYLVNGPLTGSWEGLDKDVVIVNWNYGKRDESLKFFADRGHKQLIAGYYDGGGADRTKNWLASADKVPGVVGIMYTTWRNDYSKLEQFAQDCKTWLGR